MKKRGNHYASVWDALADTPEQAANLQARAHCRRASWLVLYPDAGHVFLFQHIDAFADEVLNFLAE